MGAFHTAVVCQPVQLSQDLPIDRFVQGILLYQAFIIATHFLQPFGFVQRQKGDLAAVAVQQCLQLTVFPVTLIEAENIHIAGIQPQKIELPFAGGDVVLVERKRQSLVYDPLLILLHRRPPIVSRRAERPSGTR